MQLSRERSNSVKKILDILRSDIGDSIDNIQDVQKEWEEKPYEITTELLKFLENNQEEQRLRINIAWFFHKNEKYELLKGTGSKLKHPIKKMIIDSFTKIIKNRSENRKLRKMIIYGFTNGFLFFSPYSQSYKADVITLLDNIAGDDCENESIRKAAKETSEKKEKWTPVLYK
jgi:hypothetical protein